MRRLSSPGPSRRRGFVLLQTLWLLLLAAMLASAVMAMSLGSARDGATAAATFEAASEAESAVHSVLHELLADGRRSPWLAGAPGTPLALDAATVVAVQDAAGLVDLNTADEPTLHRLLLALAAPEVDRLVRAIGAARPLAGYAAVATLDGMTPALEQAMLPHITLFSGQAQPVAELAPAWLRDALALPSAPPPAAGALALAGHTLRLTATAQRHGARSPQLSADILITGRRDQPFLIYDWSWRAQQ
ncbi:MAG: hypothetical protein V4476_09635 [Pseudomonadota bacterium]